MGGAPLLAMAGWVACVSPSFASTVAGSTVVNIADARLASAHGDIAVRSNPAALRIDEILDLTLQTAATAAPVTSGAVTAAAFTARNDGNGKGVRPAW